MKVPKRSVAQVEGNEVFDYYLDELTILSIFL